MAPPKGNQFWKLRSKHGRNYLFENPDALWAAACEYFQWCDDNPFIKAEAKTVNIGDYQSVIKIAELPVMRPYTMHGLTIYLDCGIVYFEQFEKLLKEKIEKDSSDQKSNDFSLVCTRIREIIYEQKFTGAASGFFNASIIGRDLGLADKKDLTFEQKGDNPMKWEVVIADKKE
jgi:hypothetical protein